MKLWGYTILSWGQTLITQKLWQRGRSILTSGQTLLRLKLDQRCQSIRNSGQTLMCLTLFRMGLFEAATDGVAKRPSLPKIYHRFSTMMKLGTVAPHLKKNEKIWKSYDITLEFFHWKSANFVASRNTDIDCI